MRNYLLACICSTLCLSAAGQDKAQELEALLTRYHEYGLFNGSVLVAQEGDVIYEAGFGAADMTWDIPNTPTTRFRIASTTKQFTAALVLALVEDGLLDLDGRVVDYISDYPAESGRAIRIRDLLSHTSGIPSYTSLPGFMTEDVRDPHEPDSMLSLVSSMDLEFEPGSRWAYSNSGFVLLGAIVEAVTGRPYDHVLRDRILEPAGLADTGYDHYKEIDERRATGYVSTPGHLHVAPYLDTSVPYSAGMLYSTVRDLFKWDQFLYGGGPFKRSETVEELLAPRVALPEGMAEQFGLPPSYGFGWFVGDTPVAGDTVRVIEHGGSIFGFASGFWRMPEERNTVILLDNTSTDRIREIGHGLMSILYGGQASIPQEPVSRLLHELIESDGLDAARQRYLNLVARDSASFDMRESELNELGYFYLNHGEARTAIEIFKLNAGAYPQSANTYDSLGEAYAEAGRYALAVESYQKAVELDPENASAVRALDLLETVGDGDADH